MAINCHPFSIYINIFVAQVIKSFNNIYNKDLNFTDDFFKLKSVYAENGDFKFNAYNVLKNIADFKTNNYSNLILSKKCKNSDVLEVRYPQSKNVALDIITPIGFFDNNPDNGAWLCFDKTFDTWDMDISSGVLKITKGKPKNQQNYLFRLTCDGSTNTCTISHNFGNQTYYLEFNKEFKYTANANSKYIHFYYHLNDNLIRLYCQRNYNVYKIVCEKLNEDYTLVAKPYRSDNDNNINDNIFINTTNTEFNYFIDASWVKYNRQYNIDIIDNEYSSFTLDSQYLVHHEYTVDNSINIIPLKNNLTYKGSSVNGHNLIHSDDLQYLKEPLVDFRSYTSIHSGINQEYGNDNIILTFTFTDQDITINEGEEYTFEIPSQKEGELHPLYPYTSLNVNDTNFIRNGAFASDTPFLADKFKKLQNENTLYNNGTYLCTWLYQPDSTSTPVWLDRYYYPDITHKDKVLKDAAIFKPSFNNIIDGTYNKEEGKKYDKFIQEDLNNFRKELQFNTFVDKKSDLTLEPGTTYSYKRVGKKEVNEVYENLSVNRIDICKDQNKNGVNLDALINFNKENWRSIEGEKFNNTSAISFNTNLYINPHKKMGLQIFGSDYSSGFNIQNRKDLAPFHYYATADMVYLMNNQYEPRQSLNIINKFGVNIKRIIIGAPFDDLYILTDDSIIITEYDLKLKRQIFYNEIAGLFDVINGDSETAGEILSKYSSVVYNENIYIPINTKYNSYIVKIILNSDENETLLSARRLRPNEFVNNFNNIYDEELVEMESKIKSLYIDSDGKLYAFSYDILKMTFDGDTIYGLYNNAQSGDNWYYIFNQSIGKLYTSAAASKYAEFSSDTSIDNLAANHKGEIALIRGFRKNSTSGELEENEKYLEVYDRSKTKIYGYKLSNFTEIYSLDYYTYIDSAFREQTVFVAVGNLFDKIAAVEYRSGSQSVVLHYTQLPAADRLPTLDMCTNSNALIDKHKENKLYFNLFLPNGILNDKLTITWDLTQSQAGWYNINVDVDTDNAIFRVKINDILLEEINSYNNKKFTRHGHTNDSIFDSTYYFGCVGKDHGARLHEILSGLSYDNYVLQNTKAENTTLYNKVLSYGEYQASRLYFEKINSLNITIPCGIRNGIDEIIRYFKYRSPGFISNNLKINISGLDEIKLESEATALKQEIINAIRENADCLTNIKEIEFI